MKRRYLNRVPVKGMAMFSSAAGLNGEGRILDLTVPGCMIESTLPPRKGESVFLNLYIPQFEAHFSVSMGIVRWVNGRRFGVEFVMMARKDQLRYNACVVDCLRHNANSLKNSRAQTAARPRLTEHPSVYKVNCESY